MVNNNAAAVLLVLDTLAKGREVVVSRGQLVEIGGSFRIPEVMKKSGAVLREVGATNRTHLRDYAEAIGPEYRHAHEGAYLQLPHHRLSQGSGPAADLVRAGPRAGPVHVFEDLGSGNLFDFSPYGFMPEPTVQQVLKSGVDVVTFSGDKLLGGPQAGVIVGRREFIERIKKNQLNRALRIDKMTLAALEATLRLYLDPEQARRTVPTLAMITAGRDELLATRAAAFAAQAVQGDLAGLASVGGETRFLTRRRWLIPGAGPADHAGQPSRRRAWTWTPCVRACWRRILPGRRAGGGRTRSASIHVRSWMRSFPW